MSMEKEMRRRERFRREHRLFFLRGGPEKLAPYANKRLREQAEKKGKKR